MNNSAPHRDKTHAQMPRRLAGDQAAPQSGRHGPALRRLAMLAAAAFAAALAAGCASHTPPEHVTAIPRPPAVAQQAATATHLPAAAPAAAPASPAKAPASPTPTSPADAPAPPSI